MTLKQLLVPGLWQPHQILSEAVNSLPGFPRQAYVGILPLVLMPLSIFARSGRLRVAFLLGLAAWSIAVCLTVLTPAFSLFRMLPGATWFRGPWRIVVVYAFTAAALCGIGLDTITQEGVPVRRRRAATAVAGLVGVALLLLVPMPAQSRVYVVVSVALVGAAALSGSMKVRSVVAGLLIAFVAWDLSFATRNAALHPFHNLTVYDREAQALEFVKEHQGLYRTYVHWSWPGNPAVMPKQGSLRGIFSITDYEGLTLDRYAKFYALLDARHPSQGAAPLPFVGSLELNPGPLQRRLIDLMGVKYILNPPMAFPFARRLQAPGSPWRLAFVPARGHYWVYENPNVLPRAYVAHAATIVPDGRAALAAVSGPAFNPRRSVVLEANPAAGVRPLPRRGWPPSPIRPAEIRRYAAWEATLAVDDPQGGYLVLTDTYYAGWQAKVDGRPQPILRANYLFRAVRVPPGRHSVTFAYHPLSFQIGGALSLLGLAVIASYLALRAYRRRQRLDSVERIG